MPKYSFLICFFGNYTSTFILEMFMIMVMHAFIHYGRMMEYQREIIGECDCYCACMLLVYEMFHNIYADNYFLSIYACFFMPLEIYNLSLFLPYRIFRSKMLNGISRICMHILQLNYRLILNTVLSLAFWPIHYVSSFC